MRLVRTPLSSFSLKLTETPARRAACCTVSSASPAARSKLCTRMAASASTGAGRRGSGVSALSPPRPSSAAAEAADARGPGAGPPAARSVAALGPVSMICRPLPSSRRASASRGLITAADGLAVEAAQQLGGVEQLEVQLLDEGLQGLRGRLGGNLNGLGLGGGGIGASRRLGLGRQLQRQGGGQGQGRRSKERNRGCKIRAPKDKVVRASRTTAVSTRQRSPPPKGKTLISVFRASKCQNRLMRQRWSCSFTLRPKPCSRLRRNTATSRVAKAPEMRRSCSVGSASSMGSAL